MAIFTRMGHAALQVSDLARSMHFYKDVLELDANWEGHSDWANLKLGSDDLSLVKKAGAVHPPHLGLRVASLNDLQRAHLRLSEANVKPDPIKTHRDGTVTFYFRDPDGNVLEALWDPRDENAGKK